ncbi:MAG TPA: hypothetical protein VGM88_01790 [Kofleriaceae bacterium]
MNELVSANVFVWFITLVTGVVAGIWLVYDAASLVRIRKLDRTDALVQDRRFGYMIGVVIGAVGVIGCLRYHGVF